MSLGKTLFTLILPSLGKTLFTLIFPSLGKKNFTLIFYVVAKQSICCGVELQTEHKKLLYVGVVKQAEQSKANERTKKILALSGKISLKNP